MVSNKGSVVSLIYTSVGVMVFAFIIVFMLFFVSETKDQIDASEVDMDTKYFDQGIATYKMLDAGTVVITIGFSFASMIAAFFIKSHPIFYVFTFIVSLFLIMISAQLTNMWYEFASMDQFSSIISDLPMTVSVMQNLPKIMLGVSAIIAVLTFSKGEVISD